MRLDSYSIPGVEWAAISCGSSLGAALIYPRLARRRQASFGELAGWASEQANRGLGHAWEALRELRIRCGFLCASVEVQPIGQQYGAPLNEARARLEQSPQAG